MKMTWIKGLVAMLALGFLLAGCGEVQVRKDPPTEYQGVKAAKTGLSLIEQLRKNASDANPSAVFMVGACTDKTGKFLDADQVRYSRAVTQACTDMLANYVGMAGFKVVERDPYNMGLIAQEYKLSHEFMSQQTPGQPPKNIGLIQRGGPNGGLTGAKYMITGAISMYDSSVSSKGGGADVDSLGFSLKSSTARVGVTLRIVDVSTGVMVSSLSLESVVEGKSQDFHITRFIGDVVSNAATAVGGIATATSSARNHVVSGEIGGATQLPIDYAVIDALVADLARQLEANQQFFYKKLPIRFDYSVPAS